MVWHVLGFLAFLVACVGFADLKGYGGLDEDTSGARIVYGVGVIGAAACFGLSEDSLTRGVGTFVGSVILIPVGLNIVNAWITSPPRRGK